jgi:ATP-dependent protease HslVU (ClpYQ) ATPase subunit
MKFFTLVIAFLTVSLQVMAQDFKKDQQKQEKTIKAEYKLKEINTYEYEKLMKEQYAIKQTIEKCEKDGVMTAKEKNRISGDLDAAKERLEKYKTTAEKY